MPTTQPKPPSLIGSAFKWALLLALLIIPTAISIFVALQVKAMNELTNVVVHGEPQIVCFDAEICAIEVHGKWYVIAGVIDMENTVPEEYRLNDLLEDGLPEPMVAEDEKQ